MGDGDRRRQTRSMNCSCRGKLGHIVVSPRFMKYLSAVDAAAGFVACATDEDNAEGSCLV